MCYSVNSDHPVVVLFIILYYAHHAHTHIHIWCMYMFNQTFLLVILRLLTYINSSDSQIPKYLATSGSQWPNPDYAFHRSPACDTGTLGRVWLTARLRGAYLNWSPLVNHIGIHPLPATEPTVIDHAQYIKPRPSQFSVPHVPPCIHGNGEIIVCNILLIKIVLLQWSHQPKTIIIE